jgi:S-adenosylmethionine synthetase
LKILHLTHTDIRTDSRILKELGALEDSGIYQLYAIGVAEPLSVYVDLHGTGTVDEGKLEAAIPALVRLTPKGIRTHLGLNKPIYRKTAAYGHFGRQAGGDAFPWERTDLADKLKAALA